MLAKFNRENDSQRLQDVAPLISSLVLQGFKEAKKDGNHQNHTYLIKYRASHFMEVMSFLCGVSDAFASQFILNGLLPHLGSILTDDIKKFPGEVFYGTSCLQRILWLDKGKYKPQIARLQVINECITLFIDLTF